MPTTLENVFSWSKSRAEEFDECRRKYFYARYLSWGGWEKNAPVRVRLAYVLKNLKNRWAWKGETVHHVIEDVLKSMRAGRPVPLEEALAKVTELMRRDYRASKAGQYKTDPKRNVGLFEHEYSKAISDDVWKRIHDESAACVRHFYNSPLFEELKADDKSSWLVIEDLEEFSFENAKVYVKLDFARKKNGVIEIYDWKTGKTNGDTDIQLATYAYYAMHKWRVPLKEIRTLLVNLTAETPFAQDYPLNEAFLADARAFIAGSVSRMHELLEDVPHNIAKPAEAFAFTSDEKICDRCSFFKICEKYGKTS